MINLADLKASGKSFDKRYSLINRIGGGGFSEVWLAHDINARIDVALKIYTPTDELDEEGKDDFRREFARLCGLNHSNIIHAIGFGIHDDELPYLAMSVCENGSAKKLIGNVGEDELWRFIEQVASGLKYLHDHSVTHQDIKPDNVLINSDGQYLIIDFGISTKTRNTLRRSTRESVGGGTTWYMSVESFSTEASDIHARDIWAFGATLYEIITGDAPFGKYGGLSQKSQNGKIPPIKNAVSDELKQLVYDCLSLNSWDRPDAAAIVKRAQEHKADEPQSSRPIPLYIYKRAAAGVAALALVAGCYIAYPYVLPDEQEEPDKVVAVKKAAAAPQPEKNTADSIYLARVEAAVRIAEAERSKGNAVNERALCSAAKMYSDAGALEASVAAREEGTRRWASSQLIIDNAYEYLYGQCVEYGNYGAEEASTKFGRRIAALSGYVTPSKRKPVYTPPKRKTAAHADDTYTPEQAADNAEGLTPMPAEGKPEMTSASD